MLRKSLLTTFLVATILAAGSFGASADCIRKAGEGTATSKDGAVFQAYEAILQATDFFGTWAPWISSGGKVGQAPGYKVTNTRSSCKKGGLGFVCRYQATLCKSA